MSALTSSSQFSFSVSAQLVCCRNKCNRPCLMSEMGAVEDGDEREDVMWGVMRWEPRPR